MEPVDKDCLEWITELSRRISHPNDNLPDHSKEKLMKECLHYANLFLTSSKENISGGSNTYSDLYHYLSCIMSTGYANTMGFGFDFKTAKLICFWDFEN